MDTSVHPPKVSSLQFVFHGWAGDQLVESFPCFLTTKTLAASFKKAGLTGFKLEDVQIERDEQWEELDPHLKLPDFLWMKVFGVSDRDDFFMTEGYDLGVSSVALDLINQTLPKILSVRKRSGK